jgi:hypothetical protein
MCAVSAGACRQRRVVRDDPSETTFARQSAKLIREKNAAASFARPQNQKASAWQSQDRGARIGKTFVVGQQHQRGQR